MSTINLGSVKDLEVDLAKRDKILGDMESQLYAKRFLLLQKREALKNSMKQNRFLEEVKKDYDNYHEFLVTQKKEQIDALEYINKYVSDIQNEGNLNDEKINESRVQQEWILSELKNIKKDLNEIVGMSE
tara:strand:+ start:1608 stop:1997 length:390 start_codon:yes stop_codon:yes gene_type:complete